VEAGSCSVEDDINRVAVRHDVHAVVIAGDILLADQALGSALWTFRR